ncbi:MAG: hypothetical protein OXG67_05725 [bacterium]|nr:hypothetical protein [bacterium]
MGTAPKPSLLRRERQADAAKESLLRYDIEPEDVLDEETLAEDAQRHEQAEAEAMSHMAERDWADALGVEDLRELADRARRGEQITTLRKT